MPVIDSQVKVTCPACSEIWRMDPARARSFAAALVDTAQECEDELAEEMRRRLDAGGQP